jgi:hypothetical protein
MNDQSCWGNHGDERSNLVVQVLDARHLPPPLEARLPRVLDTVQDLTHTRHPDSEERRDVSLER